jgi:hypothetical protein
LGGEETELAYEIKYVGIILGGRGKLVKEKREVITRGKTALNSFNICLARVPNMGMLILEHLYVSLIESRMMSGVEIWGLDDEWREIGKVHEIFCKRIMGAPTAAASGALVKELGRTNKKEKVVEKVPYLRVYKPLFFDKNLPSKIGVWLKHGVLFPFDD